VKASADEFVTLVRGETDSFMPYVPGVNCNACGRFVGRDGHIGVETFEMSSVVASVDGTCARCLASESS
jgi:hypothetical protein